jgi:hypothetical protein
MMLQQERPTTCDFSHFCIADTWVHIAWDNSGEISMRENHPSEYFTVFEGIYSKDRPVNRRPATTPKPQTCANGKVAIILALLLVGAGTATAAFTVSQRSHVAGPIWVQSATFVSLPGIVTVEDALY